MTGETEVLELHPQGQEGPDQVVWEVPILGSDGRDFLQREGLGSRYWKEGT